MTALKPDVMAVRSRHTELWARRSANTSATAVRDIFAAALRPGVIYLTNHGAKQRHWSAGL